MQVKTSFVSTVFALKHQAITDLFVYVNIMKLKLKLHEHNIPTYLTAHENKRPTGHGSLTWVT